MMMNTPNRLQGVLLHSLEKEMNKKGKGLKITVVGDGCVGKTCTLISFVRKEFPTTIVPTVYVTL